MKAWAAVLVVVTSALAGCGNATVSKGEPADQSRALYLSRDDALHAEAGAAGNIVECDAWGTGGFSDTAVYAEGATADTADQALKVAARGWGFGGVQTGLSLAQEARANALRP